MLHCDTEVATVSWGEQLGHCTSKTAPGAAGGKECVDTPKPEHTPASAAVHITLHHSADLHTFNVFGEHPRTMRRCLRQLLGSAAQAFPFISEDGRVTTRPDTAKIIRKCVARFPARALTRTLTALSLPMYNMVSATSTSPCGVGWGSDTPHRTARTWWSGRAPGMAPRLKLGRWEVGCVGIGVGAATLCCRFSVRHWGDEHLPEFVDPTIRPVDRTTMMTAPIVTVAPAA